MNGKFREERDEFGNREFREKRDEWAIIKIKISTHDCFCSSVPQSHLTPRLLGHCLVIDSDDFERKIEKQQVDQVCKKIEKIFLSSSLMNQLFVLLEN